MYMHSGGGHYREYTPFQESDKQYGNTTCTCMFIVYIILHHGMHIYVYINVYIGKTKHPVPSLHIESATALSGICCICTHTHTHTSTYRMAGNFGEEFILADWRF